MMSDIFLNGGAVMTPPTTGAIFQLVDPAWYDHSRVRSEACRYS